jgi:hypothetical protein
MKKIIFWLITAVLLSACGEEKLSVNDKVEKLLTANAWTLSGATIDGVEETIYDGLTILFRQGTYSTTNGKSLWAPSGTWSFADNTGSKLLRDDGTVMDIVQINDSDMVLRFYWESTISEGGRGASIGGLHVMSFVKKQ